MDVREVKRMMRTQISYFTDSKEKISREYLAERMAMVFETWKREKRVDVDSNMQQRVIKELCDDFLGYGPIQELLDDPEITEIMVNGPYKVYIEQGGKKVLSKLRFDDENHLRYAIERMMAHSGRRIDESSPFVDFSLKDGSRVNIIIPPLSVGGASITIRKMAHSLGKVEDLIDLKTIDSRMAQFLIACVRGKVNMLFSGATGSGKTTTVEVLSSYIDPDERIVTIEDALELTLRQEHLVRLLTRPPNMEGKGEITARDLFINSLRMRPSRIILGEIRGSEAMDYIQALNSGHRGCLAVLHASTPQDAVTRLETMALYAGLNLPSWAIRKQIASGLDVIVQHEQLMDGSRKITYITEVLGIEGDELILKDLYRYRLHETDENKIIQGQFVAMGVPTFFTEFKKKNIQLDENLFKEQ